VQEQGATIGRLAVSFITSENESRRSFCEVSTLIKFGVDR